MISSGGIDIKQDLENLINGKTIECLVEEEIVFDNLENNPDSIWSLLFATGYLKSEGNIENTYTLSLTNYEVKKSFEKMVNGWFNRTKGQYKGFVRYLLAGDIKSMTKSMNKMSLSMFSYFGPSSRDGDPEMFYHGVVLGLIATLQGRYAITSNRESGYGRYDVTMEPLNDTDPAIIMEFKVFDADEENDLEGTVQRALAQIEERRYDQYLLDKGLSEDRIKKYGFAFKGKEVLIGGNVK